ncbi:hypothetical protein JAAARDRAFT_35515 [Jaapia argillacea MUCL 33604]|uniref:Alpha/beta hydrolase fold-3 domain-containing protein n=1 Tax=Jaapia argillacea MUCL 33604 TaxID=933084 RepID=A0A067PSM6_9AGAM|nr:hypothetical protein JAAARDRAFT_35515 [Jaapia argillacea MUCL 33604]
MIDQLIGRPNPSWKRTQVFVIILFWVWQIIRTKPSGPRWLWLRPLNRVLQRFTPWQLIVSTLTAIYALRNLDKILGFSSPEPLANLYSASYYRATWIVTGLDAGFATAMPVRPKWIRDICSVLFSIYYIIYSNDADEKLRKFRAAPTVEMLRATWEKTTNPYIRVFTRLPRVTIRRKIHIPRPGGSTYQRPITAWIFFAPPEHQLSRATDLIFDCPGGGFIAMTPEHHEERLRMWARRTGKPVLSLDYGKAPEYPYPFAIDEAYDMYRVLVESSGRVIGMSGRRLNIIMSGDSAGATIAVGMMVKILETQSMTPLPHPVAMVLNYAALDFNFTSWMSPNHLRVLRSEQSSRNLSALAEQKDHFNHVSPLSMVGDRRLRRRRSWRETLKEFPFGGTSSPVTETPPLRTRRSRTKSDGRARMDRTQTVDAGSMADEEDETDVSTVKEEDRPIQARVKLYQPLDASQLQKQQQELSQAVAHADTKAHKEDKAPIGTRITMTSRTGYFQDRIVSPSMMRAMAILYIGPHRNPDFATDYHISPILAPSNLLAQFPPLLMQCGERDPFVDDTVIFAGRVREAKRDRRKELELAISGKSTRFGETLRMSIADSGEDKKALKKERDRLASESEDDWVQMVIYSDWSHGYLQMPALMSEVTAAIDEIADWIDDSFSLRNEEGRMDAEAGKSGKQADASTRGERTGAGRSTLHSPPMPAIQTSSETETDDPITFIPKKRSPPPTVKAPSPVPAQPNGRTSSDETLRNDHQLLANADGHMGPPNPDEADVKLTESPGDFSKRSSPTSSVGSPAPGLLPPHDMLLGPNFHLPRESRGSGPENDSNAQNRQQSPRRPGASTKGSTTPTISESELMRRRRLLDSHIFKK